MFKEEAQRYARQRTFDDLHSSREIQALRQMIKGLTDNLARAGREYEQLREGYQSTGVHRGLEEIGNFGAGGSAMYV
jgi:predicted RNase H-like nuclease (RuvC/YqgF family)